MNRADQVRAAEEILGSPERDDYIIAPTEHAARFEGKAPALAALLRSAEVMVAAEQYEELDREALSAQKRFKGTSSRARLAFLIAACSGAALLVVGTFTGDAGGGTNALAKLTFLIPALIGILSGAAASVWINQIRAGDLLAGWMEKRARAETQRLHYFDLVTRNVESAASAPPAPLLQLEYFRRFQLDTQRNYYKSRAADHRSSGERALSLATWGMGAVAAANGVAGVMAGTFNPAWASLAGIAVVGHGFSSMVSNAEATNQDQRNAERYARTRHTLDQLFARLDAVRGAVAAGRVDALREFVASVHEQLSLEHREWIETVKGAGGAVDRLDELLAGLAEEKP